MVNLHHRHHHHHQQQQHRFISYTKRITYKRSQGKHIHTYTYTKYPYLISVLIFLQRVLYFCNYRKLVEEHMLYIHL